MPIHSIVLIYRNMSSNCLNCNDSSLSNISACQNRGEQESCPSVGCSKELLWNGCSNCSDDTDSAKCISCSAGTIKSNGKCVHCGINECCPSGSTKPSATNCLFCDANQAACVKCIGGYNLTGSVCTPIIHNDQLSLVAGVVAGIICVVVIAITFVVACVASKKLSN